MQTLFQIPRKLIAIALTILVGGLVYADAIGQVIDAVINRNDSSHGVFVPFMSAYFLFISKERIKKTPLGHTWLGTLVMAACLAFLWVTPCSYQLQFIAFIIFACGAVITFLGPAVFKRVAFPILFLIAMTPLPPVLYDQLANWSRTIAFGGSLKIISVLGIPHLRVGWDIELPNALLRVAISCSGIRYLISFVVFGMAYAFLYKKSVAGRIATVLATLPISIVASIFRLTIIFVLTYHVSPYWSHPRPHVILSWIVFVMILAGAVCTDRWHEQWRAKRSKKPGWG